MFPSSFASPDLRPFAFIRGESLTLQVMAADRPSHQLTRNGVVTINRQERAPDDGCPSALPDSFKARFRYREGPLATVLLSPVGDLTYNLNRVHG